ncbi:sialate O-acetylesterase [Flavobacterium sp. DG1-102-2]|uniref:sialate O-acetylesterase n=1 Tax=Flavobacterium sp. DG1-102-2 TaxID=3081663 RepID=UPI0029498311|nr:sialate O-acetylesterase [Flavobacterium sp. DG1-102-2]MDV6168780.1 sialate O-acetylesterase [Flavobacterium sp. DG1-102-2]
MKKICSIFILLLISNLAFANVSLPNFISDNMVLQRNSEVKIWGWASPFEDITIKPSWTTQEYKAKPTVDAYWEVLIKTPDAGGPFIINFKGYNELTIKNVMSGEVWFCSGQSNMEWTASQGIDNAEEEIAKANYPNIRFFTAPKLSSHYPQMNVPGNWSACTPQTMKYFSAIGYFFAERLQKELKNIPIGIINSSWGGSPAEVWIPELYVKKDPVIAEAAAKVDPVPWSPVEAGRTYNAMIYPFVGYKIAGVLWYQGEANVGSDVYDKTLGGLIKAWRTEWKDDFPFYLVQIAPYKYDGGDYHAAVIRDAQRKVTTQLPKTGMISINDISTTEDIHPRNKRPVGERLANLVLSDVYTLNKGIVNGPLYKSVSTKGNKLTIYFSNAAGLRFKGKTSAQFEVAGRDGRFYQASAKIEKESIVVTSKEVRNPVKVRYAWRNTATADVFNSAWLPMSTFTSE